MLIKQGLTGGHVVCYVSKTIKPDHMPYDVPLYPTDNYPLFEATAQSDKVKLKNVTWCMGDKPCKTIRKAAGCWVNVTR